MAHKTFYGRQEKTKEWRKGTRHSGGHSRNVKKNWDEEWYVSAKQHKEVAVRKWTEQEIASI